MKKYYTGFIYSTDQVEQGGWATNGKDFRRCVQRDEEFMELEGIYGMHDQVGWRRVELVVCTRDFKVGELISFDGDKSPINLLNRVESYFHLDRLKKSEGNFFSIIGIVANNTPFGPNMEFDEEEIKSVPILSVEKF